MPAGEPAVLVERDEHTLIITLNRPAAMNSIDAQLSLGVGTALDQAQADPDVRVVIITGSGDRAFCAGADLKAVARGESIMAPGHLEWGFAGYLQRAVSKPTIAAVNGLALGGGMEIVLASDLAVATEAATFGLPEVRRGLFPAGGGAFRLPTRIPTKIAMELLLTGETFDAPRALELGLINQVVSVGGALDAARDLARRIAGNAPLAVQAVKRVALGAVGPVVPGEALAWARSNLEIAALFASEDAREGTRAFAEKRPPVWRAR